MPISVEIEGKGSVAEFPDGTSQAVIDKVIKRDYFSKKESFMDRVAKASSAESEMMSNPANAEILRTAVGGGAAWIPAGVIKAAGIVSGQREGADELANIVQEKIVGTPSTDVGKLAQKQISAPFEKLSEKSQEYADIVYDKTGSPLLATATRVAGEALPFAVPYAAGKGLKAVKGAVKAPEIDLGKVSEKPTSITPDVSAELKASLAKKEVKAPEVKAEEPIAGVEKVEPTANVDPLITEARKYKSAEEFVKADRSNVTKMETVNPETLTFREEQQHRTENVREMFDPEDMPPITVIDDGTIIDGHNRAIIAKEEGIDINTISIPKEIYDKLKEKGFDDIEISYAMLRDQMEVGFADNLDKQFPGANVQKEGFKALDIIEEERKADLTSIWNKAQEGKVEVKTEMPSESKPAKAALDINKDLIEKGFEGLPERELARYNPIQKAEEMGKVQALVGNPDFFEMAKGNKPLPQDVHPQVLFNVAINEATKAGNIDMLMDLAKSPIAEQRSLAAQQLGASAWEKPVNNIVKTINEVKKVRESKIKNPKVKEVVKTKLKEEVQKINLSADDLSWNRFLDKIIC